MDKKELEKILKNHSEWRKTAGKKGKRADLRGAYLRGADLQGAYLQGADLRGAYLRRADLQGAYLRGADLQGACLRGADLQGADLQGADLRGADLQGADLRGAYLRGAYLRGADLQGADLQGACLRGADLRGAAHGENISISKEPLQILGLRYEVFIFDTHIKIGCELHSIEDWRKFNDKRILAMDNSQALRFWRDWKEAIIGMAEKHQAACKNKLTPCQPGSTTRG